ncbi:lactonase family protein [Paenibacillus tarimensis]
MEASSKIVVFIGSYAEASDHGVYACLFDRETGSLELSDQVKGLQNPTFLDVDTEGLKLYALTEELSPEGKRRGAAAAFDIDPDRITLTPLNKETTVQSTTCHIVLDRSRQNLIVSSYHGGMVGVSPLLEGGKIGITADVHQHEGSSVLPVQNQPRVHSAFIDLSGRFAAVCDLGLDRVFIYKLDPEAPKLVPHGAVSVEPGAGPRHFAFHPTLPYGYVINELNSTITSFSYDEERGNLEVLDTVSTLPDSYEGDNACADIHISPDGKFLYGSNRGHDSIAVYAIDPDKGKLSIVEYAPTLGGHPRNFAISPDGRFLLAANRDSNQIVTFVRDAATGRLQPNGHTLEVSKPVCLKFVSLP